MSLIESGRVVKIEIVFKVPVQIPAEVDPRGWAMSCVSINGEGLGHVAVPMQATVGSIKPPPLKLDQ